jgi:lipoprotein signal peptidase
MTTRENIVKVSVSLALLVIGIADALFKAYAIASLPDEQTVHLQSVLSFALHRNPGIAFDIAIPLAIVLPITAVICGAFAYIVYKHRLEPNSRSLFALASVIGALGNGLDRLINGFTTDYIILFQTSAINLSDVLILVGILGVLWYDRTNPSQVQTQA